VTVGTGGVNNELSLDGGIVVILLLRRMDGSDSIFAWNKMVRGLSSDEASASSERDYCAIQRTFPQAILLLSVVTMLNCDCKDVPLDS
jgi:hypothetical protein